MVTFIHNRIPNPANDGNTVDFKSWYSGLLEKMASEKETEKVEQEDEPKGNINNDNEPEAHSYQEGESTGKKKKDDQNVKSRDKVCEDEAPEKVVEQNTGGKGMGECDDAGKVTEDHKPAASAEKDQVEQVINNDPNYQKGESTNPASVTPKNKKSESKKPEKKASFKSIDSMSREEKLQVLAMFASQETSPVEYAEFASGLKFANLTPEEKQWLTDYWTIVYPPEYVEQMVANR